METYNYIFDIMINNMEERFVKIQIYSKIVFA